MVWSISARIAAALVSCVFFLACSGDTNTPEPSVQPTTTTASSGPVGNACPAEGCVITITDVAKDGDELAITWDADFDPDVSKNHIHVFWDIYTADQVSSDAEARGEKQGEWVPTDAYPTYTTGSAVSVDKRGDSTTLCVTAGDRDHAVIDSSIVDCQDVSDLL